MTEAVHVRMDPFEQQFVELPFMPVLADERRAARRLRHFGTEAGFGARMRTAGLALGGALALFGAFAAFDGPERPFPQDVWYGYFFLWSVAMGLLGCAWLANFHWRDSPGSAQIVDACLAYEALAAAADGYNARLHHLRDAARRTRLPLTTTVTPEMMASLLAQYDWMSHEDAAVRARLRPHLGDEPEGSVATT